MAKFSVQNPDGAISEYDDGVQDAVEPDVIGFFSELSRDPVIAGPIGDLLATMMQPRPNPAHAPQAALAFGVGLGQVADRGDPRVFLDAWHQALERDLLTPELVAGVQQLAQAHNLPAEFVEALAR